MTTLPTKLASPNASPPTYGSPEAAGMDLYADLHPRDVDHPLSHLEFVHELKPGERKLVKTGVQVAIPVGSYGRIAPRSGLAYKHGIDVLAGVIDSDYRGEIGVILINFGDEPFIIKHGDRIAQMIITPHLTLVPVAYEELPETGRGGGGFGSTGK